MKYISTQAGSHVKPLPETCCIGRVLVTQKKEEQGSHNLHEFGLRFRHIGEALLEEVGDVRRELGIPGEESTEAFRHVTFVRTTWTW